MTLVMKHFHTIEFDTLDINIPTRDILDIPWYTHSSLTHTLLIDVISAWVQQTVLAAYMVAVFQKMQFLE